MKKTPLLDDLWNAMRALYAARYKSEGSKIDPQSNFDMDTFNEIASLQTKLQTLISRLEREHLENDGR